MFEHPLFSLLNIFLVFFLSPREFTFQEVSLISSSGDFEWEVSSSIILVVYG